VTTKALVPAVAVAVVLALQVMWLDDPWDSSQGGEISGGLTEYSCKAFDAHGWAELGGRPTHFFLPWDKAVFRPLDHHPPAPFLAYYASWRSFGRGPAALRAVSFLLLIASLCAVACLGRQVAVGVGAVAAAFMAAAPATVHFACIAEGMPWAVAFMALAAAAWGRWRAHGGRVAFVCFWFAALAGGLSSWYGGFLLPALWLGLLIDRGRSGRMRAAIRTAVPFVVGIAAFVAWIAWSGGAGRLLELWSEVIDILAGRDGVYGEMDIVLGRDLLRHARNGFTDPILVLTVWGALSSLVRGLRRGDTGPALPFCLLAAGVMMQVAFASRSATHAYLSLILAPGVALCAARAVLDIAGLAPDRARLAIAAVIVLTACAFGTWKGYELRDASRTSRSAEVARLLEAELGERDVAVMFSASRLPTLNVTCERSVLLLPPRGDRDLWNEGCAVLRPGRERMGRLLVFVEASLIEASKMRWVSDLPRIGGTLREVDDGSMRWWVAEIDKARVLDGR
jgi:hypothetical protein